jgi:hypothetical protein
VVLKANTAVLVIVLSLTLLASFPNINVPRVHGATQSGPTTWSPFGPREKKLTITDYGDFNFTGMFNAFRNGQIDITDWPINTKADLNTFQSNPDFFVTNAVPSSRYDVLWINSRQAFMGISLNSSRSTIPPSFVPAQSAPACSIGFGSLTITLQNQETGKTILDSLNTITAANQPSGWPSATVSDQGGSNPSGVYQTPCLLAGNYALISNLYNATGSTATITSGQKTQGILKINYQSVSNVYPSVARSELGAALAHMIDKDSFAKGSSAYLRSGVDTLTTAMFGLSPLTQAQINTAECQFNNHPWLNVCNGSGNDTSAYNISPDSISAGSEWWQTTGAAIGVGLGYSGHDDLRAACDDLVSMGLQLYPSGGTCNDVANAAVGTSPPTSYPHIVPQGNVILYARTYQDQKQEATIIADTINFLFGTPSSSAGNGTVCYGPCPQFTPKYYTISQVIQVIYQPRSPPIPWLLTTNNIGPYPTSLYYYWSSESTNGVCGGITASYLPNFHFYCNPAFDTDTSAGLLTNNVVLSHQLFSRASYTGLLTSTVIPLITYDQQYVELNGWNFQQCTTPTCTASQSSIVNSLFRGTQTGYWTLLNARQVPGHTASNPMFAPGGGDSNLIRRGFSDSTNYLSPFMANGWDEVEVINMIFDSMLQANPLTFGTDGQLVDWQTSSHGSSFNPGEVGCLGNRCVTGVTTQIWHLRNDLKFQDGNPVTANDVAYTIFAFQNLPSHGPYYYYVYNVVSAVGTDCGAGQPCKTLQVKLLGKDPTYETNIGSLPIVEKKLWAPICGDPVSTDPLNPSPCSNPAFDPMAVGIMVGSGPWKCTVPAGYPNAGHVGGPCTVNADGSIGGQTVTSMGKFLLTRNDGFARCCPDVTSSSLYKLSWADKNNDGVVNILDLADAAVHFGTADPYWVNSNIAQGTTVNIQDLATVAFYFGHGTTYPFQPSRLTGLDPQIDPFFCPNTGC